MNELTDIFQMMIKDRGFSTTEEAEMNLAERVAGVDESKITTELITTIEAKDIPETEEKKEQKGKKMGFCVA